MWNDYKVKQNDHRDTKCPQTQNDNKKVENYKEMWNDYKVRHDNPTETQYKYNYNSL